MELWDIYDENRKNTGKTIVRGEKLKANEFHLVVHIWIMNSKGEFLIQKRAPGVKWIPGLWAVTGGSAIKGDDSKSACVREMSEELGITPEMEKAKIILSYKRTNEFVDVWLIRQDFDTSICNIQEEEVSEVKWASIDEITELAEKGQFWRYSYLNDMMELVKKGGI